MAVGTFNLVTLSADDLQRSAELIERYADLMSGGSRSALSAVRQDAWCWSHLDARRRSGRFQSGQLIVEFRSHHGAGPLGEVFVVGDDRADAGRC